MHVQHSWVLFCFILAGFGILSEPLVAQVETKPGEPAKIQSTQADSLSREEKARIALQMFQEGIDLFKQQKLDAMKSAIEKFKYAQQMFNELGEKESEAWVWVFLGRTCDLIGEKTKALEGYKNAFALHREIGNENGKAIALNNIGSVYSDLGDKQMALKYFIESLPIFREMGNRQMEATTLNNIGAVYSALGEKQIALKYYADLPTLFRALGDRKAEGTSLNNIGVVYSDLGEKETALSYYNLALPLRKVVGDQRGEAETLSNFGLVYCDLGENQTGLKYLNESLLLYREIGDIRGIATVLSNLGGLYANLGEKQTAFNIFTEALSLFRTVRDQGKEAVILSNLGNVSAGLGENQSALKYLQEALSLCRIVGDRTQETVILNNLGNIWSDRGETQKALQTFNEALILSRMVGDRGSEAKSLNNIGKIFSDLGESQKAHQYYAEALPLYCVVKDRSGEGVIQSAFLYFWNLSKKTNLAIFYGKQSINLNQALRASINGLDKNLQRTFLKTRERTYCFLIDLLIAEGRLPEALQVLRMLKEDEYFEFVQKDKADASWLSIQIPYSENELSAKTRLDTVLEHFVSLTREFDELNRKEKLGIITEAEKTRLAAVPDELKRAQSEYESVLEQITKDFDAPVTETSRLNATKELTELQTALKTLNCVAVFTLAAEQNCHTILVTPEQIVAGKTAISRADLTEKVADFRAALTNPGIDPRPIGKELYQILVGPIAKALEETHTQTVMWSLDGTLRYLPPAALWDGKQYLAERFQMSLYTIEPKTLEQIETQSAWTGLGLGVSEAKPGFSKLPGVQAELQGIIRQPGDKPPVGILTGNRLLNQQFTETAFRQQLQKKYPLVHIASHFSFKPGNESQSALLLGDGSLLSLTTIKQSKDLFGGVDLLALSACQTAMGSGENERAGAEIEGFGVLAQRQGARAVLATLWSVADDSTAQLMKQFYQIRQSNPGMSKAEALRQAQLKLLGVAKQVKGSGKRKPNAGVEEVETSSTKSETKLTKFQPDPKAPYSHPYYWAPFILIGNWK